MTFIPTDKHESFQRRGGPCCAFGSVCQATRFTETKVPLDAEGVCQKKQWNLPFQPSVNRPKPIGWVSPYNWVSPPTPARLVITEQPRSRETSVPVQLPGAGCTTMPDGLFTINKSSSSYSMSNSMASGSKERAERSTRKDTSTMSWNKSNWQNPSKVATDRAKASSGMFQVIQGPIRQIDL